MFGLSRQATLLWLLVVGLGSALFAVSVCAAARDPRMAPVAAFFAVAAVIAETFQVAMPGTRPGNVYRMSVGFAVIVAAFLVLPWAWAVVAISTQMLFARVAWFKKTYNVCQICLTTGIGGLVWNLGGAGMPLLDPRSVLWVLLAVALCLAANVLLVGLIIAFASGLPLRVTVLRAHRNTWPATLGLLFIGVLIAVLWTVSGWTIALAAIPLTAVYYTLRNTVSLETNTVEALFSLADILDARDSYTHGHSLRVGQYAERLALQLGVSADDAYLIFLAGRLHDIGKCAIRNEVLLKPGALDDEERAHMCIHPAVGGTMLASFALFKECARYVRGHHERFDGQGYPDGLAGEAIPLGARVIAVVDAFDAMTTTRPYRKALPLAEARRRLTEGAGTQWDPAVVSACVVLLDTTSLGQPEPVHLVSSVAAPAAQAA
jgi:HD-GYP domain-containing protein (c-di-GMP phosphodiesterase class II)